MSPDKMPDVGSIYPSQPEPASPQPDLSNQHIAGVIEQQFTPPDVVTASNDAFIASNTAPQQDLSALANTQPTAVVKVLSPRGLEYLFMSICLWMGATALAWGLLLLVNGQTNAQLIAMPATTLLVTGPVFAWLFIRLKKAELENPALRFDASKRRTSQITQIVAFLACIINLITFIYLIISSSFSDTKISIVKLFLNLIVILLVAGGVLAYYWFDEHRSFKN